MINSRVSRNFLIITALPFIAALATPVAHACMGTPPPLCARTLAFSTGAPGVVLAPGGVAVNVGVPGLAYFNVIEAPPGACPPLRGGETASLVVSTDVECTGPNDGSGALAATPINTRFNEVTVDVSLDAGPPRLCDITNTATATLLDGTSLIATSSNKICVAESLPGMPNVPRLDLRIADGGSNTSRVHPGDQTSFTYRITNNDPNESFQGTLSAALVNSSRGPQQQPPGDEIIDGPFAISSPVSGDNFPIGFSEDLVNGCLFVPRDHANPTPSMRSKTIELAPGESIDVEIYTRPFGGCSDGSCGVASVVLDGTYSDMTEGLACAGFVAAADTTVSPQFEWADSGAALAAASSPAPFVVQFIGLIPDPLRTVPIAFVKSIPTLEIGGEPFLDPLTPESFPYEGDRGRITATAGTAGTTLAPGGTSFSYVNEIQLSPGAPFGFEFTQFAPSAPPGAEDRAPGAVIEVAFTPFGATEIEWFLEVFYQFSGNVTNAGGETNALSFDTINVGPGPNPNSFIVAATGSLPTGDGSAIETFRVANDLRGFARPASDYDLDGIDDHLDNCILQSNADQRDTNDDGFGNICDADLNNDGIVNTIDLGLLRVAFFSVPGDPDWNPDADFNGDDVVNAIDLGRMKSLFFQPPGPGA